jgi:hypothetical protein
MANPTNIGVVLLSGHHDGPRIIECRTFPLRVYAAPWSNLPVLLDAGLPGTAGIYLLSGRCGPGGRLAVRPGEAGDLRRRLLEHAADPTKSKYEEIYVVASSDGRLSKSDSRHLEARIHEIVMAGNLAILQVDRVPSVHGCSFSETVVLDELLHQSRELLHAAGCRVLDAPRMPIYSAVDDRDDGLVELVDSGGVHPDEHALDYDRCWSWGYPVVDGFVVRAGSDVRRRQNAALLPGISARRNRLLEAGLLGEMPGVTDRWRLLGNFKVASALIAAKVVTGAHVSNSGIWRRLAPANRIISMDVSG